VGKGCAAVVFLSILASGASAQTSVGVFGGPAFFTVAGGSDAHLGPAVGVALDVMLSKKVALALRPGFYEKGASDVGVAHLGSPVLLKYPASAGPYLAGGFEVTFHPGESWERETSLALTGGAGVRYGEGRLWGFVEARYSWSPQGGDDGFVCATLAPNAPPGSGGCSPYSSASPSYRGVVIVGAVMLRLGSK
jgi:hypothetical protein